MGLANEILLNFRREFPKIGTMFLFTFAVVVASSELCQANSSGLALRQIETDAWTEPDQKTKTRCFTRENFRQEARRVLMLVENSTLEELKDKPLTKATLQVHGAVDIGAYYKTIFGEILTWIDSTTKVSGGESKKEFFQLSLEKLKSWDQRLRFPLQIIRNDEWGQAPLMNEKKLINEYPLLLDHPDFEPLAILLQNRLALIWDIVASMLNTRFNKQQKTCKS